MGSTGISSSGLSPAARRLAEGFGFSKGFKDGDTAKAIQADKTYYVTRTMSNGETRDYGRLPGSDVKPMIKGYKFNGFFWDKEGAKNFYTLQELD